MKYTNLISVVCMILALGGAYVAVDQRYAHAEEVKKLEMRLEQKILEDRSQQLQERIWKIEDRKTKNSQIDNETYRSLQNDKSQIDSQIKVITEQAVKMGK